MFPVAFLPQNHALAIAIMSYNGRINFGLLADYDAMEDVEIISKGIADSLEELLEAAKERSPKSRRPSQRRRRRDERREPRGGVNFHLELTPPQLKVTHTALKSLLDDFGHDEEEVPGHPRGPRKAARRAFDPRDRLASDEGSSAA